MAAVKTVSLTKEYSDGEHYLRAVDDISFTVEETEFVAIIGSSGCGKTTLLNLLGGLENPTHGCIISMMWILRSYLWRKGFLSEDGMLGLYFKILTWYQR